jgi:hypothetical protein
MSKSRKPWPMKWVALATAVSIILYTFLTLHYRKTGKMFEPYHDMKDRANTVRLLSAGFQRIMLETARPLTATPSLPAAPTFPARGGLPPELDRSLIERPRLPLEILSVHAPSTARAASPYAIELTCTQPDNHQQLGSAALYVHDDELVIVPDFEQLSDELLSRTRDSLVHLTVPAGTLKPGRHHVTLIGAKLSQTWTLDVR